MTFDSLYGLILLISDFNVMTSMLVHFSIRKHVAVLMHY